MASEVARWAVALAAGWAAGCALAFEFLAGPESTGDPARVAAFAVVPPKLFCSPLTTCDEPVPFSAASCRAPVETPSRVAGAVDAGRAAGFAPFAPSAARAEAAVDEVRAGVVGRGREGAEVVLLRLLLVAVRAGSDIRKF